MGDPKTRQSRGMAAARRVENTVDLLRRVKRHIKSASPSSSAVKAKKQRKKLRRVLEQVQRSVIQDGLGKSAAEHLETQLDAIDAHLTDFLALRPKKKVLKEASSAMKQTRKALAATLS